MRRAKCRQSARFQAPKSLKADHGLEPTGYRKARVQRRAHRCLMRCMGIGEVERIGQVLDIHLQPQIVGHIIECRCIQTRVAGVRRTGSAALDLAWVAAGRFDAYWERDIQPWDMAAGIVIVREAGGIAGDIDNKPDPLKTGHILAANEDIYRAMQTELKAAGA